MKKTICSVCHKKCNLQCSKCRCVGYCNSECQLKDWPIHKKWCSTLISASRNKYIPLFDRRKEIILEKDKTNQELLMRELLYDLKSRLKCIKQLIPTSFTLTSEIKIFMLYDYSEEYLCSILLMVRLYLHKKDKANAKKALDFLYEEWEKECQRNKFDEYFMNRPSVIAMNKNYKNYKIYLGRYLRLYSSCILTANEIGNQNLLINSMILYLSFIEGLAVNTKIYESFIYWTAMTMARFFVMKSLPSVAISLFDSAIKYLNNKNVELEKLDIFNNIVELYLNEAYILFSIDNREKALEKLNDAIIEINEWKSVINDPENETDSTTSKRLLCYKSMLIYQTKAEIDITLDNYINTVEDIDKYILMAKTNDNSELSNIEGNKIISIILSLISGNADKKPVQQQTGTTTQQVIHIPFKKKSTLLGGLHSGMKRKVTSNKKKEKVDYEDFNNLFLFLARLTVYQTMLLNQTQPKMDEKKFASLPIHFSEVFKASLSHEQRMLLFDINGMNLTRNKFLVDPLKPISFSNLKYYDFYPEIFYGSNLCVHKKNSYNKLIETMKRFSNSNFAVDSPPNPFQQNIINNINNSIDEDGEENEQLKRLFEKSEFYFGEYKEDFYRLKTNLTAYIKKNNITFRRRIKKSEVNFEEEESSEEDEFEEDCVMEIGEEDDDVIMMMLKKMTVQERKDLADNPQLIIDIIKEKRNEIIDDSQTSTIVSFSQY